MINLVKCRTSNHQERAICVDDQSNFCGWVFYKHADGQWVTLRKASEPEIRSAKMLANFDGFTTPLCESSDHES